MQWNALNFGLDFISRKLTGWRSENLSKKVWLPNWKPKILVPAADDSSRMARNDGYNSSMRQNDSLSLSEQIYGLVNGAKNAYLFRLLKVNILNNLTLVIIPS